MGNLFINVPVGHEHVGKRMFAIDQSGKNHCGEIEFFGKGVFVCAHNPDPKDPFRTTGTVIKEVLVEFQTPSQEEICQSYNDSDIKYREHSYTPLTYYKKGAGFILDSINKVGGSDG